MIGARISVACLAALAMGAAQPGVTGSAAAQLHVDKYQLGDTFNGTHAPAGRQFAVLDVRWRNILTPAMPYVIPDVRTQLQLIVNGESGAKLRNADFKAPDLLSAESQRLEPGKDVSGRYVFEVTSPVTSLELAYFDKVYGNIRIPIMGKAPAAGAGAFAGPATSGG